MSRTVIKGVLKTWKEDRGFGFIKPENGGKDIFIHISALKGVSRRPVTGDVIYYQSTKDNRGKFKAINASIEGVEILNEASNDSAMDTSVTNPRTIWLAGLGIALVVVAALLVGLNTTH